MHLYRLLEHHAKRLRRAVTLERRVILGDHFAVISLDDLRHKQKISLNDLRHKQKLASMIHVSNKNEL